MAKLQKFTFDLDFGASRTEAQEPADIYSQDPAAMIMEAEEELPPPPPPPMFSEDDLALAREQAFEAGRAAGLQEAEMATERLLASALQEIPASLREAAAADMAANETRVRDCTVVAMTAIKKLQPAMAKLHALDEIEVVIQECLAQLDRDVRVTIRVNPALAEGVREYAERAAQATAFEGKLVYTADPRVPAGDCRVEWGDGGAERDEARIWAEIDTIVLKALGVPNPQPPQETEIPA
ncbi:MAG TPA: FliH/SctL family protein [Patescibacteria group bacterium]|nr:FliH/SctL family protein [Patescibacteria group bacterium]